MTDHSELKRLAEAATPGPWYQHGGIMQVLSHDCETVCETFEDDGECPDAQFIAAANPTAVLALIAENEEYKAVAEQPASLNAVPATEYAVLKRQFFALRNYALCKDKLSGYYSRELEKLRGVDRSQSAGEIDAERDINEQLTNDLLTVETERDHLKAEIAGLRTGYEAYERVNAELKAENEALRREREGKVLCDLELFETLRDSANTEADEHRQCMATYRPLRQANLDSVVKKCDDLLAAMGQGEQS